MVKPSLTQAELRMLLELLEKYKGYDATWDGVLYVNKLRPEIALRIVERERNG